MRLSEFRQTKMGGLVKCEGLLVIIDAAFEGLFIHSFWRKELTHKKLGLIGIEFLAAIDIDGNKIFWCKRMDDD